MSQEFEKDIVHVIPYTRKPIPDSGKELSNLRNRILNLEKMVKRLSDQVNSFNLEGEKIERT